MRSDKERGATTQSSSNTTVIASEAKQSPEMSEPQNPQTPDQSIRYNEDGSIDTSDWKTYVNEEYGFSVKYPMGWEVDSNPYKEQFQILPNSAFRNSNAYYGFMSITIENTPYVEEFIKNYNTRGYVNGIQLFKIISTENFRIGLGNAKKLVGTTEIGIDMIMLYIVIDKKSIVLSYGDMTHQKVLVDTIVSTFQIQQ